MISKIERTIAFRYLKPKKKEGFLKVISIFSFTGIALGVAILIIVMSVMNGFRTELINKILGFNPHIIVKPYENKINKEDLDKDLEQINVKLDESSTEFKQETSGLLKKQEKAEKQIAILAPRRTRLLKKIPKNIQRFYERCQESGVSTPICAIIDKSCSGCHMVLLPQLINELMSNPNSHKNCPNCTRILYFPESEEETVS